ncbi:MAG: right-handed parallel beta-helix repeat-containing protein [Planctomycetota bacterium]|jgi:predicted outer membrane repeat protein
MKTGINSLFLLMAFWLMSTELAAGELQVPSQYQTIQSAMNMAADGDTIIVAQGTYLENVVFGDTNLKLTSTDPNDPNVVADTVIDANGSGTTVIFPETEDANYVFALNGFTITGGDNTRGGGVHCHNGNITISNCIIAGNRAMNGAGVYSDVADLTCIDCTFKQNDAQSGNGGGIYIAQAELMVIGCTFIQNSAALEGGGVTSEDDKVTLRNCTFQQNTATWGAGMHNSHYGATVNNCTFMSNSAVNGGGICMKELREGDQTQRITHCTFSSNTADDYGGAVSVRFQGNLIMTNCILWENLAFEGPQISLELAGNLSASYCCVQGGLSDIYTTSATVDWPTGNIDVDPCFADAVGGDCHLRSTGGRWDPNQNTWVIDANSSLCIDAGNPGCTLDNEPLPNGDRVNMGAYGRTAEASRSPTDWNVLADLTNDRVVDYKDLRVFVDYWLEVGQCIPADLSHSQSANFLDFAIFSDSWGWRH